MIYRRNLHQFYIKYKLSNKKSPMSLGRYSSMAESMRFELMVGLTTQPFQDCTLSHSDKTPFSVPFIFYLFFYVCQ